VTKKKLSVLDEQVIPPAIEAWIKQLLDPAFINLISAQPYERVDVKLSSSKNRVSRLPQIIFNGGQQELIDLT
jgi:hypothetical protein